MASRPRYTSNPRANQLFGPEPRPTRREPRLPGTWPPRSVLRQVRFHFTRIDLADGVGRAVALSLPVRLFHDRDNRVPRESGGQHDPRCSYDVLLVAARGTSGFPSRQAWLSLLGRRRSVAHLRSARGRHGMPPVGPHRRRTVRNAQLLLLLR